ncbi:MAG: mandelate racemase/muconate lactonizing enzyme family protein [Halobacteriales archaeon]
MTGFGRFSLPLDRPLATAAGTVDRREGFLVRVGEDRPVGVGEATPLPGWTESIDACRDAIASTLADLDPSAEPAELQDLPATPAARHGLELALLDRASRAAGVPLYRHLGGRRRVTSVPVNATVGDGSVEETADEARLAAEAGYDAVKVKVGARPVEEDVARLSAVREAVGPDVELRVDANGAWDREAARNALEGLLEHDVAVIEQPLAADDLAGHADLRGRGPAIALDETLRAHAVDAVLDAQAADVLVVKPMVQGGVERGWQLARTARERGAGVVVTTTVDAAVARTAAVHLAAALEVDRACGLATADRLARDIAGDPAPVVDGRITVPQAAGHGIGVDDLD